MTTRDAPPNGPSGRRGQARRPYGTRARRAVWVALLLACAGAVLLAQKPAGAPFHLVFTRWATDIGNEADVQAAVGRWTEFIGSSLEKGRPIQHELTEDAADAAAAIGSGRADFAALSPIEFLEVEPRLDADPFVTHQSNGEIEVAYVLVAGAGVRSPADLVGKRAVLLLPNDAPHAARLWLEVLLREAGLPWLETAFSEVKEVRKSSQALLPVYFGQADVALLPRSSFLTGIELNPDLGRKLHTVATSPAFVKILVVVSRRHGAPTRARWMEGLQHAHDDPRARQLFNIFKLDRFVPCTLQNLANVRAILSRYDALVRADRQGSKPRPARAGAHR